MYLISEQKKQSFSAGIKNKLKPVFIVHSYFKIVLNVLFAIGL